MRADLLLSSSVWNILTKGHQLCWLVIVKLSMEHSDKRAPIMLTCHCQAQYGTFWQKGTCYVDLSLSSSVWNILTKGHLLCWLVIVKLSMDHSDKRAPIMLTCHCQAQYGTFWQKGTYYVDLSLSSSVWNILTKGHLLCWLVIVKLSMEHSDKRAPIMLTCHCQAQYGTFWQKGTYYVDLSLSSSVWTILTKGQLHVLCWLVIVKLSMEHSDKRAPIMLTCHCQAQYGPFWQKGTYFVDLSLSSSVWNILTKGHLLCWLVIVKLSMEHSDKSMTISSCWWHGSSQHQAIIIHTYDR